MKKIKLIALSVFFLPLLARAEEPSIWMGKNKVTCFETGPCSFCDGLKLLANITDFIAQIAVVLAGGLIIYGGILILFPPGDAKANFIKAKKVITNAVLGVIIISVSWIIINSAFHILSGDTTLNPLAEISCDVKPEN